MQVITHGPRARKNMSSDLNLAKMYALYESQCHTDGIKPLKLWAYRHIFNNSFNLSFHHPVKDSFKKCDIFKAELNAPSCSDDNRATLERDHELHLRKAEKARASLKHDSETHEVNRDVITFDLQKVMPVPFLSTNEAYYCRQLSVYNLGLHSTTRNKVIMNVVRNCGLTWG